MTPASESADFQDFYLQLPAELTYLPVFLDQVRRAAEVAGLTAKQGTRLEVAVEEALVNVFHYAYAAQGHPGTVTCRVAPTAEGLTVEIADEGLPFDPLARPDPHICLDLDQRQPGGLGILMIRQLTDNVSYCRQEGRNILTIHVRKDPPRESPG